MLDINKISELEKILYRELYRKSFYEFVEKEGL